MKRIITALTGAVLLAAALTGTGCVRHWDDHDDERHEAREHRGEYREGGEHREGHDERYERRYR